MILPLIGAVLAFSICKIITPIFLVFLADCKALRENFRKDFIPIGAGLIFPIVILITFSILSLFYIQEKQSNFILAITTMAFVGFIDDLLGNHKTKGLIGHFKNLFLHGTLSTGILKALWTAILAIYLVSFINEPFIIKVLDIFILLLFTNSINLLDLRPGRAIKSVLLFGLLLIIFVKESWYYIFPLFAMILAFAPWDFNAKAMMGDTGSNFLGISLGFLSILYLSLEFKIIIFNLLVILHIYAEKYSITELIENNKFLKFIDKLGRT